MNKFSARDEGTRPSFRQCALVTAIAAATPFLGSNVFAQEAEQPAVESEAVEEVLVTGSRATNRNRIEIKRNATSIVDGLSASDIGDLPALSIGEALESITGVSSHRENGGATEVSIRGLGPYLSATTFNGREATNGSGDRSVNFSQFPSELMNKIAVYKTQDASLIEGGVAGLIELETLKPLSYDEQRIQVDLKGNYNPDQQDIEDSMAGDWGHRATFSFVDQFNFEGMGDVGVSFGYQVSDISQPEQEVRSSSPSGSSIYACLNDPAATWEGYYYAGDSDCEDQRADAPYDPDGDGDFSESNQGYITKIDPATGKAYSDGLAYAFAPSSRGYRQNDTSDERDAVFLALQWQPNEDWDVNFDMQLSDRVQSEQRHDLNFANQKRSTENVTGPGLVTTSSGAILEWVGETAIESNSEVFSRSEDYKGFGLNIAHQLTDKLSVSVDYGFSETTREELQVSLRTQSDNQDIYNMDTAAGYRPLVHWDRYSGIPQYTITDFDVTDHTLFSDEYRARIDSDVDRTNTVEAFRADFDYEMEGDFFTGIEGGIRVSELSYLNLGGTRYTTPNLDDSSQAERDAIEAINQACAVDFPEDGFLSSERSGDLITTVDSSGNVVSSSNSWATFDTMCVTNMILDFHGEDFAYPDQQRVSPSTTDVTESTTSAYLMANFATEISNLPLRGNFGVRVVNTDVESVGYRTDYEIITDSSGFLSMQPVPGADLERVVAGDDYTEVLPSMNVVLDLTDDMLLRGGIFKGMSRPDPSDLNYNRGFRVNTATDITDPNDLITDVSASGNPATGPLTSWNFDASWEWYPNEDSMLSVGVYHKTFTGGFEQVSVAESFTVDGQTIESEVLLRDTVEETNGLSGVEVSASHRLSYLPSFLSGLGVKASYNYADSDFEFEDENYGDVSVRNLDGSYTQTKIGIVAPGNLPGFSEHVFSGQVYYQIADFDMSVIYKYRSEYFQPYTSNGNRLRYVGDVGVWEARASYDINDTFQVKIEAINLFNEPKQQYFYVSDNLGEVNSYGPRIFLGLRAKF